MDESFEERRRREFAAQIFSDGFDFTSVDHSLKSHPFVSEAKRRKVKVRKINIKKMAKHIRAARKAKRWSMNDAALRTGPKGNQVIPEQYWSKYENGRAVPSGKTLFVMAQVLEVSADYLIGLEEV